MKYNKLGTSDLEVSKICLGTMTWGEQNTETEAHEQLDYALDQGINFFDTAEMYPVPPSEETYTLTEQYIGTWEKLKTQRDKIILATKVAGPSFFPHIRGNSRFNKEHITKAIEGSLKRLNVDYLDLYQLHWPDRSTNYFGQRGYIHNENEEMTPILETLEVLATLKAEGKVRHFGLSNETPWGTMKFLELATKHNLPRMVSIQNPYSLLNRTFEIGLSEVAHREQVDLLAYSPLAFGVLSGKYLNGQQPTGARLTLWERFSRYSNEQATNATEAYVNLAKKYGLSPVQMALSFVTSRAFIGSNIIGATTMAQLKENIASINVELSDDILDEIEAIHTRWPNPAP